MTHKIGGKLCQGCAEPMPRNAKEYYFKLCSFCSHLKNKYQLTWVQYAKLFIKQNGLCAICRKPETATKPRTKKTVVKRFAIDHCHKTGEVRGLLCARCNTGIGNLKDSEELLLKAIEYLKNPPFRSI